MSFSRKKGEVGAKTPIDLFSHLKRKDKFNGLIHPQVPLLQAYFEKRNASDISIQLTTAGGKTLIGLLIGEWRRRPPSNERVLYLTPTRQLANQVANEAKDLGISNVVLQGRFLGYDPSSIRKYTSGKAIAISNYAAFFNQSTRFKDDVSGYGIGAPHCLICDDAHAADNIVSNQWSLVIKKYRDPKLFNQIIQIFEDFLPDEIAEKIYDSNGFNSYRSELVPSILTIQNSTRLSRLIRRYATKDDHKDLYYPFQQIKNQLHYCQMFFSDSEILIRPWISPTWTHNPFSNTTQRIYLSATLGENSDLERIFGIHPIVRIEPQDDYRGRSIGQRFILSLASMQKGQKIKDQKAFLHMISQEYPKALLLTPTDKQLGVAYQFYFKELYKKN